MTNVDRSPQNPNLLLWHGRLWLIDHGAALYLQHAWEDPPADARKPFPRDPHARPAAVRGQRRGGRRAARATADAATSSSASPGSCPTSWYAPREREQYAEYLCRRLEAPRGFAAEAEEARRAA